MVLLTNQVPAERPRLDVPGAVAASLGLFVLVFGFSQAEPRGWTRRRDARHRCRGRGAPGRVRVHRAPRRPSAAAAAGRARPQPRRLVPGGAASPAPACSACSCSSPTTSSRPSLPPGPTGLAFLPMSAAIIVIGRRPRTRCSLPRFGPKPLDRHRHGCWRRSAMVLLAQLGVHSTYAATSCPALLVMGSGSA